MSQSTDKVETVTILRHLEDLELRLAKLYRLFSEKFEDDAEAAFVFYRMSLDERSHASLIRYESRLVKQNPKMFPPVRFDLDEILAEKVQLNRILDRFGVLGLQEAVCTSLDIEGFAAESHCRSAVAASVPELGRLLASLGAADKAHVKQLKDFAGQRGFSWKAEDARP